MSRDAIKRPAPLPPPDSGDASTRQRRAANPDASSWVGASAGSGKTKVLTDRILRLLLPREDGRPGTPPHKILALTYTKAGASEMAIRLSQRLSDWAVISGAELESDMAGKLLGRTPTDDEKKAARKLFAQVVDTPGGLPIMTIHSFCQSVLGRFPLEAGLAPNFRPLEEEQAAEILDRAMRTILSYAATNPGTPVAQSVRSIARLVSEDDIPSLIKSIVSERKQFHDLLSRTFGIEGLYTALCARLDIQAGLEPDDVLRRFFEDGTPDIFLPASDQLAEGSVTDQKYAAAIRAFWRSTSATCAPLIGAYTGVFTTGKGDPKKPTNDTIKKFPVLESLFESEYHRVRDFTDRQNRAFYASAARDLFRIGAAVLGEYTREKEILGALDFDDMILYTLSLFKGDVESLKDLEVTPWVLYKLDEGIDHILVDEAQDTNPEQWDIIEALSDEFFAGIGASEALRTIFVVGDKKQSIYGFQRAAPEKLGRMRTAFEEKIRAAGQAFDPVDMNTSFRSVPAVLNAVDTVFADAQTVRGLGDGYLPHIAHRTGQPGVVEVWPLLRTPAAPKTKKKDKDIDGWALPDSLVETPSGALQMANKIAATIRTWQDNKEWLESKSRPIDPGDILILVSKRNAFVGQLVRALKENNIPVHGVDRLVLSEQIAVQDMAAGAAFALLPDDDLTLATLLKSPFIGLDEQELYDLAHGRSAGKTLWENLQENAAAPVKEWLSTLIATAGRATPYAFFNRMVHTPCPADTISGLHAIYGRLGEDAMDPVGEFLNAAIAYEQSHTPALQSFLHWYETGKTEIKREMDKEGGAVRIMTVHGSKGLQAPIVFLPDTVRVSAPKKNPVLWPHKSGLDMPYFTPPRSTAPAAVQRGLIETAQAEEEEYRRLLYVAMTRAEDRLYIGGFTGTKDMAKPDSVASWYRDIRSALENYAGIRKIPSGIADDDGVDIPVLRLQAEAQAGKEKKPPETLESSDAENSPQLPAWIFKTMPVEETPPRPLTPSKPASEDPAAASPRAQKNEQRFKRGNITHKLLQLLPDLPDDRREKAARTYLSRPAFDLSTDLQDSILKEAMTVLNDPVFGALFGPDSMAEVPVTGLLEDGRLISGQIDRLLIRKNDILIIDFKTNRPPPSHVKDVPVIYIRQMKAYSDSLKKIYPEKDVKAALLWTDGARLMVLDRL